ncbi:hypothetical protein [Pseudomonas sp. SBB6]|uniref:hypothetical protein n=1 Tax=Pseudomonas sp. SBB6 TaxID=2962032 RepID=UPI0020B7D6C8|nr:hypothetical protein [Pseudomonas sp. SBB6]MCP3751473.1 hypothetical protein [Pseudomonas sp. SBB6]
MFPVSSVVPPPMPPVSPAPGAEEISLLSLLTGESLSPEQRVMYERVGQDYQQAIVLAQYWLDQARAVYVSDEHQAGVSATSKLFLGSAAVPLDFEVFAGALHDYLGTLHQEGNLVVVPDGFFARNPASSKMAGTRTTAAFGPRSGQVVVNGDVHIGEARSIKAAAMTLLHESSHSLGSLDMRYAITEGQYADVSNLIDLATRHAHSAQRNAETWMMFIYALAQRGNVDEPSQQFCALIDNWSLEFGQPGLIELRVLLEPFLVHLADTNLKHYEQAVMADEARGLEIFQLLGSHDSLGIADGGWPYCQDFDTNWLDALPVLVQQQILLSPVTLSHLVQNCEVQPGQSLAPRATAPLALALHRIAHAIATEPQAGQRTSLARTAMQRLFEPGSGLAEGIAAEHRQPGMRKPCLALLDVLQASLAVAPELRDSARQWLGIAANKPTGLAKLLEQKGNPGQGADVRLRFDSLRQQLKRGLPIAPPAGAEKSPSRFAQALRDDANTVAAPSVQSTMSPYYLRCEQARKDKHARLDADARTHLHALTTRENALAAARAQTRAQDAIEAKSREVQYKHLAGEQRRMQQRQVNELTAAQSVAAYHMAVQKQAGKKAIEQQAQQALALFSHASPALTAVSGSLPRLSPGPVVDGVPVAALQSIEWGDRRPGNYSDLVPAGLAALSATSRGFDSKLIAEQIRVPVRVQTRAGLQTHTLSFAAGANSPAVVAHRPFTAGQLTAMQTPGASLTPPSASRAPILTLASAGWHGAEIEAVSTAGCLRMVVPQATLNDAQGSSLILSKTNPMLRR